jgi:two-component SAPR family response regulator
MKELKNNDEQSNEKFNAELNSALYRIKKNISILQSNVLTVQNALNHSDDASYHNVDKERLEIFLNSHIERCTGIINNVASTVVSIDGSLDSYTKEILKTVRIITVSPDDLKDNNVDISDISDDELNDMLDKLNK